MGKVMFLYGALGCVKSDIEQLFPDVETHMVDGHNHNLTVGLQEGDVVIIEVCSVSDTVLEAWQLACLAACAEPILVGCDKQRSEPHYLRLDILENCSTLLFWVRNGGPLVRANCPGHEEFWAQFNRKVHMMRVEALTRLDVVKQLQNAHGNLRESRSRQAVKQPEERYQT